MVFERKIFQSLKEHLSNRQVTVITGMRRTGKTTLVKQLMGESDIRQQFFFDLERLDNRALFSSENYDEIVLALRQMGANFEERILIALDEIQLSPNIPSIIKYLYDRYDIKFIATGSSSYYIKNKFQESLAGRKKLFELYPLDFGELLTFNGISFLPTPDIHRLENLPAEFSRLNTYYQSYVEFGGFPEVVLMPKVTDKVDLLHDILSSYINIDIVQLSDIRKTQEIGNLIQLLAARIGNKLDVSKISSLVKISRPTVENYLAFLESTYIIKTLPVYALNPDREIVKARKLYFLDNGLANISAKLSGGAGFENAVFNQLLHFGDLAYYQLKNGNEIDFILDKKHSFEVKETGNKSDFEKLMQLSGNLQITRGNVICKTRTDGVDGLIWAGMIR